MTIKEKAELYVKGAVDPFSEEAMSMALEVEQAFIEGAEWAWKELYKKFEIISDGEVIYPNSPKGFVLLRIKEWGEG